MSNDDGPRARVLGIRERVGHINIYLKYIQRERALDLYPYNWTIYGKISVSNAGNVLVGTEENGRRRGKRPNEWAGV